MTVAANKISLAEGGIRIRLNLKACLQLVALITALGGLLRFQDLLLAQSLTVLGYIGMLCAFTALALTYALSPSGPWSPAVVYLGVFSAFHFGLTSVYSLGLLSDEFTQIVSVWFFRPVTEQAVLAACLAVLGCAIGVHLGHLLGRSDDLALDKTTTLDPRLSATIGQGGAMLVVFGVALWYAGVLIRGGPGLLIGSYESYLRATSGFPMAWVWLFMGTGLSFAVAAGPAPWRRLALGAFGAFLIFALPIGLRGEVLFTSLSAAVIAFRRGWRPSLPLTLGGAAGLLFAVSLLRQVRILGAGETSSVALQGNLFDGLAELGASLRPLTEVIAWQQAGEPAIRGASYWAPIDRALCVILPARPCLPAEIDDRLMNVLVQARVGPIGFSPVAEAYHNFGKPGVILVLGLIGFLLGRMDQWQVTPIRQALIGIIMVELLINVRNDFTVVPAHIAIGLVFLTGFVFLARLQRRRDGLLS